MLAAMSVGVSGATFETGLRPRPLGWGHSRRTFHREISNSRAEQIKFLYRFIYKFIASEKKNLHGLTGTC